VSSLSIPVTRTATPRLTETLRDASPFGAVFTDHVLVCDFADGRWGAPSIVPYGDMPLVPGPLVAHYGQGIFEGLKAYPRAGTGAVVFRPDANHRRMVQSCRRMAMPEVPADLFIDGIRALVAVDRQWLPEIPGGTLYIRPVMFATGDALGVKPSDRYRFLIELCPVGAYFSGAVDLIAEETYVRAFPGGTGAAKCAGNYAGSLVAQREAQARGFHNVLWLDGIERRWVEEAGLMNIAFVIGGAVVTPALNGSILPGVTRDSVLTLLRDAGIPVDERRISLDEVFDAHEAGTLAGAAGLGTAATVAPIGRLRYREREITLSSLTPDSPLARAAQRLDAIRTGTAADVHHWLCEV
jgi:branched-chain amino acid aminotransferase